MELSKPDPKRWLALALLCAAQFIVILDTSITQRSAATRRRPEAYLGEVRMVGWQSATTR